jgi:hypothetical protein
MKMLVSAPKETFPRNWEVAPEEAMEGEGQLSDTDKLNPTIAQIKTNTRRALAQPGTLGGVFFTS